MEQWIKEAKERAKFEAELFIEEMEKIASDKDIDREWFINEVVKNIHKNKKNYNITSLYDN